MGANWKASRFTKFFLTGLLRVARKGLPSSGVPQVSSLNLTINPNADQVGTNVVISITVTDTTTNGVNTVISNFFVTVTPVVYAPTLSTIPAQTVTAGSNLLVGFTVSSRNQGLPTLAVRR